MKFHMGTYSLRIAAIVSCALASGAAPSETLGVLPSEATGARADPSHPFRLSIADVSVTGSQLEVRVRFFWDDLEFAIKEHTSDMEFRLEETADVDMAIERYVNEMLTIDAGGATLRGRVAARGIQDARNPDEVMWWYALEYPLDRSVERVHVQNRLLFNLFEDQRNLVHLTTRSGRERTYYFSWDEDNVVLRLQ